MSLIPMNFDEVVELKPATPGRYDLTISACEKTVAREAQTPQYKVSVEMAGQDGAPNITHFVSIPSEKDDADKAKFKALLLKRWCSLFGIPLTNGMDDEALGMSMVGARASSVEVTLSEPDKNSGAVYNRINVPKLKGEGAAPRPAGAVAKPPKS